MWQRVAGGPPQTLCNRVTVGGTNAYLGAEFRTAIKAIKTAVLPIYLRRVIEAYP